jgi:dienelactone hydrolase
MIIKSIATVCYICAWLLVSYIIFLSQVKSNFATYITSLLPQSYDIELKQLRSDSAASIHQLHLYSENGFSLEAHIKFPHIEEPIPALLLLGGMMTGKNSVEYAYDVDSVLLIAPDYPYQIRYHYDLFDIFFDIPAAYRALYEQIRDNLVLLDFLRTWDRISNKQIGIVGYSFGVPFALATAAIDTQLSSLALVYGGADIQTLVKDNLTLFNPFIDSILARIFWYHLNEFEPLKHASQLKPLPLIIINGMDDNIIPNQNAVLLHDAFEFKPTLYWLPSQHVHPKNKKLSLTIISILKSWYKAQGFIRG